MTLTCPATNSTQNPVFSNGFNSISGATIVPDLSTIRLVLQGNMGVIAWTNNGSPGAILCVAFNNGVITGSIFQISAIIANNAEHFNPHLDYFSSGYKVGTWNRDSLDGSKNAVYFQLLDSSNNIVGSELQANSYMSYEQFEPRIAVLASGNFMVTWTSGEMNQAGTQDGDSYGVFAQMFTAQGNKISSEFQVNGVYPDPGPQQSPDITALQEGGAMIVYQSNKGGSSGFDIYARIINASGQKEGSEILVNTAWVGDQVDPKISTLQNNNVIITWTTTELYNASSTQLIKGQILDANGNKVGNELLLLWPSMQDCYVGEGSVVTETGYQGFAVAWSQACFGGPMLATRVVYLQLYDNVGCTVGETMQASTAVFGHYHYIKDIAHNGSGTLSLVWGSSLNGPWAIQGRTYTIPNYESYAPVPTDTPTPTPCATTTAIVTSTVTSTMTMTVMPTPTPSYVTVMPTPTPSYVTLIQTQYATAYATVTESVTTTTTITQTATVMPTPTPTSTPTPTPTPTPTVTVAPTASPSPHPWGATEGNDVIDGSENDDVIEGLGGHDTIRGSGGGDTIYGNSGRDSLYGGNGNDKLYGGDDDDELFPGAGDDTMWGGEGTDTFIIEPYASETKVIQDFNATLGEVIKLRGFADLRHYDDLRDRMTENERGVTIDLGAGQDLILLHLNMAALSADSFVMDSAEPEEPYVPTIEDLNNYASFVSAILFGVIALGEFAYIAYRQFHPLTITQSPSEYNLNDAASPSSGE